MKWIDRYCAEPSGRYQGRRLRLSPEQQAAICAFYDDGQEPDEPFRGVLGAALALVHLASRIARDNECEAPPIDVDIWTIMRVAARPELQAVLEQHGSRVFCPALNTAFPRAA
jgi:hypothetical protein